MTIKFPVALLCLITLALAVSHRAGLDSLRSDPQADGVGLELERGDRICLLGGAVAERMQHHGWLEARIQGRFPELELSFRNLGFGADELDVHQRTMNFGKLSSDPMELDLPNERFVPWDRYLGHLDTGVLLAFFGYNESFAGRAGLGAFREKLESFVDHVLAQRYDGENAPRLVLFSSLPHEDTGDPNLPDGREHNARIELYNGVMAEVAAEKGVLYVDLYGPMLEIYAAVDDRLTINGMHLTERGNELLSAVIDLELFGPHGRASALQAAHVRPMVLEKNLLWFNRYRATDGYNVYGGRSRLTYDGLGSTRRFSNYEVMQREMDHLDALADNRDRAIHALARGEQPRIDDSNAPPLLEVLTNKAGEGPGGEHLYLESTPAIDQMKVAPGMKIEVFADERQFPELVNPVQMAWDTKGRLWVAVWPTYPHWRPDLPMNDKLLILEDTDQDGRADECTVFAGDLHNPTGFEFWNGGVLLGVAPDLVFLKDTDGDDRADHVEHLLHGLSSADTHHAANSFVLGPDGALYFQEGTFHQSQIETIHGPVRNHNGCVWRYEPRTHRVDRYIPYNYANPHGHVFDRWGQDFMTDGTGNVNYYALPFSGFIEHPQKHAPYFPFFQQRSRPAGGTEILSSSHFPPENQGNYLIANVIGFRGIFQYRVLDDSSGFAGAEVDPIVESSDLNFRPVDLEVGPDGALYFVDWHNSIIGHMQHHLRDPSRDLSHGRVYRVTCEGRPLVKPEPVAGRPIEELVRLLESPEDRLRYRVRIELSERDTDQVLDAAKDWVAGLDPDDPDLEHQLLEALWLHQQHNRIDRGLLERLLEAEDPRARAAATRVLRYSRFLVPDALELLKSRAIDEHPRVRLEAVVAASFFDSAEAASMALEALRHPTDRFLDYGLSETMRSLEPRWKEALRAGEPVAAGNPAGIQYLLGRVSDEELLHLPRIPSVLRALVRRFGPDAELRMEAARELARLEDTQVSDQLLAAIEAVDQGDGMHTAHVLHDLGMLLGQLKGNDAPSRSALVALAEQGRQPATRAMAYAALIEADGTVDAAWTSASSSAPRLTSLLDAVGQVNPEELRLGLADAVRPLMFAPPARYGEEGSGTGIEVAFYEPAPSDARRETLAARSPQARLMADGFTLDLEPANRSDSFGLLFEGTLFVPGSGRYTFGTNSDDGSRVYIDGVCVVDNDGDHGMRKRSGEVDLSAGPHGIVVTYYEKGGGEGLQVTWEGPGVEPGPIPTEHLGTGSLTTLRAAAIRAMARIPGRDGDKLADATRLLGDGMLLDPVMELLDSVPLESMSPDQIRGVVETLVAYVSGLSPENRTLPSVSAALAGARRLAAALPSDEAARTLELIDGLGGTIVLIRTLPHQMRYDLDAFKVEAGKPVSIVFQNNDVMPHNLVVTLPGTMAEVGMAAERLAAPAAGDPNAYVPAMDEVLWHTRLLFPGETQRLSFVAPETPGEHPYVCTYPGHWRVMNGVMHVVEELSDEERVLERKSDEQAAPAREFVRDWAVTDLAPRLRDGWERGRDRERGRMLFDEAGCIKCHQIDGGGAIGGPELTAIREKFRGEDLLRHVIEPSLEIAEEYRFYIYEREEGPDVIGRVLSDDGERLTILPNLLEPDHVVEVDEDEIVARWDTRLSPMPTGLLVTFDEEEILDLLSFLQASEGR